MKHFYLKCLLLFALQAFEFTALAYDCAVDGIYYNLSGSEATVTFGEAKYEGDIVIPDSIEHAGKTYKITKIGKESFNDCIGLTSIVLPSTISKFQIEYDTKVYDEDHWENIPHPAFKGCNNLKTVTLNSPIIQMKDLSSEDIYPVPFSRFFGSQVTSYILGEKVERIGLWAFMYCKNLTDVIILSKGVESIGENAFYECTSLKSFTIPEGVTTIDYHAFYGCTGLTSVTIPSSVTTIEGQAFEGCTSMTSMTLNSLPDLSWDGRGLKEILPFLTEVILGENITSIPAHYFEDLNQLTSVSFPKKLTAIGAYAFSGSSISSVDLPATMEIIDDYAFKNTKLTSVELPSSLTSIGSGAFANTDITSITIPSTITSLGSFVFDGCNLISAEIDATEIPISCFSNNETLKEITIGNHVKSIGNYAFNNCTGLTEVTLGNDVTDVGAGAFSDCSGLTTFTMGNGVQTIGNEAFYGCKKLTAITIPEGVTSIGSNAFNGCTSLGTIIINSTQIGTWFQGCPYFERLVIGENVTDIDDNAFKGCIKMNSVTLNLPVIKSWFSGLVNLKEVVLGEKVKSIGASAFVGCERLTAIAIPSNISSIDPSAFDAKTTLSVKNGSKSLLALWNAGYLRALDADNNKELPPTTLSLVSTTQCTATIKSENFYSNYENTLEGGTYTGKEVRFTSLKPASTKDFTLTVVKDDVTYTTSLNVTQQELAPKVEINAKSPTTIILSGDYTRGDARILGQTINFNGKQLEGRMITDTGLEPDKTYPASYTLSISYGDSKEDIAEYTGNLDITTDKLVLTTLPAKVVSPGNIVVAAESNITNDAERVGFEWRRNDAPEQLASKSGEAFLYEGTMEGFLRNLATNSYWKFRPYYQATSGVKVYGDWGFLDAEDDSYFEPTVHTYASIVVEETEAEVKGYVMQGTDEVEEQGFVYWIVSDAGVKADRLNAPHRVPSVPTSAKTVKADGQVMTAKLSNLFPGSNYRYTAYVKTAKGMFYGEEQSFKTTGIVVAIEELPEEASAAAPTVIARYDLNGHRLNQPQRGVNILRMSDGTMQKVLVK